MQVPCLSQEGSNQMRKGRRTTSFGIPGTGISYITSSGGSKRNYKSPAYNARQQMQLQKQQQKMDGMQENTIAIKEYNNMIEIIKGLHKECDDVIAKVKQNLHRYRLGAYLLPSAAF
jgi:hypothetical protein